MTYRNRPPGLGKSGAHPSTLPSTKRRMVPKVVEAFDRGPRKGRPLSIAVHFSLDASEVLAMLHYSGRDVSEFDNAWKKPETHHRRHNANPVAR